MARDASAAHMEEEKKVICKKLMQGQCRHLSFLGFKKCTRYHSDDEQQLASSTECSSSIHRDTPTRCYFFAGSNNQCPYLNHRDI